MSRQPAPYRTVLFLAAAQLRHEWVLTACLVAALAAVLAPLLVLLGLKEGTIETLRERLVEDPVYREVRPAATRGYGEDWFANLSRDPRVAFVLPTILPASSVIQVNHGSDLFDLVPTAAGDPLLLENGGTIPRGDECVLSHAAALALGVKAGDRIRARVSRSRGGQREVAETELTVAAVLGERAGGLPRIYAPLGFVRDVESYKEGRSVPKRDWTGASPRPHLSYRGALVLSREPFDPISRSGLAVNTGLLHVTDLTPTQLRQDWGLALPQGWVAYRLSTPSGSVTADSIKALERKLRGRDAVLLPDAGPLEVKIAGRVRTLTGISLNESQAADLGLPPLPWGRWNSAELNEARINQALGEVGDSGLGTVEAEFAGASVLRFPLRLPPGGTTRSDSAEEPLIVPAELTGLLRTARDREVLFDAKQGGFISALPGFRGFRLFARSIDDVPELAAELSGQGIAVIAEVEAIRRIQILDQGLTRLFQLIALLGVVGGAAVLIASLYASVERERGNIGILRLVGLARHHVFYYPLFQGQIIAGLGILLALAGYAALAALIDRSFNLDLAPGAQMCQLPAEYLIAALLLTLLLALLSSLIAAWSATRIEPAEAIRQE